MTATSQPASFLAMLVDALDASGIEHMVVGSFASTFHGEPRTTQDLDIVIAPTSEQLEQLVARLDPERFYLDPDVARDALRRRTMFNVIEMATAWKADLVIQKARAFSTLELGRRRAATILGVEVKIATAEDTIISKLEWAKAGGSDRQLADIAGIVRVRGDSLEHAYLEHWVDELGVRTEWQRALALR